MADEKKTEEKPKRKGASSLYDNSEMDESKIKSKKDERAGEEHAEERKVEGEADESAGASAAATGDGNGDTTSPRDKFMEGLKAIRKRHEKERADYHNGHREHLRGMSARHDKEFSDHYDLHFKEGGTAENGKRPEEKTGGEG